MFRSSLSNLAPESPLQQTIVANPDDVRAFLAKVFTYMTMALAISGGVAYWFGHDMSLIGRLIDFTTGKMTILGWVVMLAPLALVFVMGGMVNRLSGSTLLAVFVAYSALTGASLSFIFLAYTTASIATVFFVTAAVFGLMAVAGYTTKTDLTKLGSILFIGLIGIVIASLVNMFLKNDGMSYVISILSVIIFTGLTAYDMQRLKNLGGTMIGGTEMAQKMALMGALSLYLDFLNLFLALLRLFGNRK
ncbi:MAG TPA: Bax inhibitor-1/YccA family protein [Flavobacteriales bacterium]|nr:Bax inhibitor-1/YccA family protein [Flavobacteriales bacterium]HRO38973.1 Bax inhibitor-1/YccA family protein [Flavobacteriales bacterium]HRP81798.1 Bax inhibitor-1/YccA family protein [Flavobacteriales bacterium]HRQ84781.1 Bax inhibitor-1/YccA family protein [Flavobacteriales bacterium]